MRRLDSVIAAEERKANHILDQKETGRSEGESARPGELSAGKRARAVHDGEQEEGGQ